MVRLTLVAVELVVAAALVVTVDGHHDSSTDAAFGPAIVPRRVSGGHRCVHDSEALQRAFHGHGIDITSPQEYAVGPLGHGFHEVAVSNMRILVSTRDLTDPTKYCTAVGDERSDFWGGTTNCSDPETILTDAKRALLLNTILPAAIKMHTDRIKVTPISGNLKVTSSSCSQYFNVTAADASIGFAKADFVLYVAGAASTDSTIAWATYCQVDQNNRPIVGLANFNPYYINNEAAGLTVEESTRTAVHELTHAFGFSSSYLQDYKPEYYSNATVRGKTTAVFTGPKAVAAARTLFDCPSLTFVELEDEGGDGTATSHWERRNHFTDLMCGISDKYSLYSDLTMAYLEDLGFYTLDHTLAEPVTFASGMGCSFLSEKCLANTNPANGPLYCNDTTDSFSDKDCTFDYMGVGSCSTFTFDSALPEWFQYFSDPTLGGTADCTDYCPMVAAFDNRLCNVTATGNDTLGTYYGPGGRCVRSNNVSKVGSYLDTTTMPTAMCVRMRCPDGVRVEVQVGGTWVSCPSNGSAGTVSAPSGYSGTVTCPEATAVCSSELFYGVTLTGFTPRTRVPATTIAPIPTNQPSPMPNTTLVPTTATAVLSLQVTFSGSSWQKVLDSDKEGTKSAATTVIATALKVDKSIVVVDSVAVGSLVVSFRLLGFSAPSASAIAAIKSANVAPLALFYFANSNSTDAITVASVGSTTPATPSTACGSLCIGLIVGGAVLAIVVIVLVVACVCAGKCRSKSVDVA